MHRELSEVLSNEYSIVSELEDTVSMASTVISETGINEPHGNTVSLTDPYPLIPEEKQKKRKIEIHALVHLYFGVLLSDFVELSVYQGMFSRLKHSVTVTVTV